VAQARNPRRAPLGSLDRKLLKSADAVLGVDEVGRGCLAGPVVVCGVRFDRIAKNPLIQDSKRLSPNQRDLAAEWVISNCRDWLLTEVWVELIDRINILEATRLAMRATVRARARGGDVVILDNVKLDEPGLEMYSPKAADSSYFCVAAASVLAKVHRDRLMVELEHRHPDWQWSRNKGYGTESHRRSLQEKGSSYLHRKTFRWSPVLP
jgi:ribonuclease HII